MSTRARAVPSGWRRILDPRRVVYSLGASAVLAVIISPIWITPLVVLIGRALVVGFLALLAFGLLEQWPARLPAWLARWALQALGVALAVPVAVMSIYVLSTPGGEPPFWQDELRLAGFTVLSVTGLVLAPWLAMTAMLRQRDADARAQALAFDLERSELERRALDARLRLLQAQVEPHFLFNCLANVRALVESGSPQASSVLGSLIAYLRAAVPRLHEPMTTMGQELQLVRAYLELMHMRMPDRLQFDVQADAAAMALRCPPMTLMPLVENAVRHGIDPSEVGGRIDVSVEVRDGRCRARVTDTGVGLREDVDGLGTGLSTLRERLQLAFSNDAQLRVGSHSPRGVTAEVDFPAKPGHS
ncbi:MAG TPA: histidine kinase [Burkholderiaceae bacterium]|nr:histidine kinase [Burkholderiaceae bacterium]